VRDFCQKNNSKGKVSLYFFFTKLRKQKLMNEAIAQANKKDLKKKVRDVDDDDAFKIAKKALKQRFLKKSKISKIKSGMDKNLPLFVMWL
jgi:hypothetical protein